MPTSNYFHHYAGKQYSSTWTKLSRRDSKATLYSQRCQGIAVGGRERGTRCSWRAIASRRFSLKERHFLEQAALPTHLTLAPVFIFPIFLLFMENCRTVNEVDLVMFVFPHPLPWTDIICQRAWPGDTAAAKCPGPRLWAGE